jgi:cytochrome P450
MHPPEIKGHWLWGSVKDFRKIPHLYPGKVAMEKQGIARFRLLHRKFIGISHPDFYEQVIIRNAGSYGRAVQARNLRSFIGRGLLSTDGEEWSSKRQRANPAFSREALRELVPLSGSAAEQFLKEWFDAADKRRPVPITQEMQRFTMSVICKSLFSVNPDPLQVPVLCEIMRESSRAIHKKNTSVFPLPFWIPTRRNTKLKATRDALSRFVLDKIAERSDLRKNGHTVRDILETLLNGRHFESLDNPERIDLIDECKALLLAGFETTALSLTWALYLLSNHPEIATRWHEECDRIVGDREPRWEDLEKLTFTRQILLETLRIYPAVFTQPRSCLKDDIIGGYKIKKGDLLLLSIYGMHHDPSQWPEPFRFDPDRFGSGKMWPRKSYLPFGKGKHICIGNSFALSEMLVILAMIGRRFAIERTSDEKVGFHCTIALVPDREILLIPRRRL